MGFNKNLNKKKMKEITPVASFVLKLVLVIMQLINLNKPIKKQTFDYSTMGNPVLHDSVIAKFKAMHQVRMDTTKLGSLGIHKLR
jgi:hypothetical protein